MLELAWNWNYGTSKCLELALELVLELVLEGIFLTEFLNEVYGTTLEILKIFACGAEKVNFFGLRP